MTAAGPLRATGVAAEGPVDAHFHVWRLSRGDYGWLQPSLAPIYRDVDVADWRLAAAPHGISAGVVVQAAPTEAETAYLLAQAHANPDVLGVVGWVDMLAPDAAARVRALAKDPKLKGLRPMLQDIPDPQWILQAALAPALEAVAECGLAFDALVKPAHLPHILTLARRHHGMRIVIDHAAKPDMAAGAWQPWADDLSRLAEMTHASCKLSGLLTEAGPAPPHGKVAPWAAHVLACFGADRVLWGSDWPVLELSGSYERWWDESLDILSPLPAVARAAVLGDNARAFYRL